MAAPPNNNNSQKKEEKVLELTEKELEEVTTVFRSYETGLREATIYPKDLHPAMKMLGLNPMEQEIIDLTNEIARNGFIYFPEFCTIITRKYREEDEEVFRQNMFKMLCGTEPFPELFRAKKYKIHDNFLFKKDFKHMMLNLPVPVSEQDIEEMFDYADKDKDGKISYKEFQIMINPPKPAEPPKPSIKDFQQRTPTNPNHENLSGPFNRQQQLQHQTQHHSNHPHHPQEDRRLQPSYQPLPDPMSQQSLQQPPQLNPMPPLAMQHQTLSVSNMMVSSTSQPGNPNKRMMVTST